MGTISAWRIYWSSCAKHTKTNVGALTCISLRARIERLAAELRSLVSTRSAS